MLWGLVVYVLVGGFLCYALYNSTGSASNLLIEQPSQDWSVMVALYLVEICKT